MTPKKNKYWRYDPVATFEEASRPGTRDDIAYARDEDGVTRLLYKSTSERALAGTITWLKETECCDDNRPS